MLHTNHRLRCTAFSIFRAESLFPNFRGIAVLLTAVPLFWGWEVL